MDAAADDVAIRPFDRADTDDVLALWRERAAEVSGRALPCGHYVPEEAPDELLAEALAFFSLLLPPSQHAPAGDTP